MGAISGRPRQPPVQVTGGGGVQVGQHNTTMFRVLQDAGTGLSTGPSHELQLRANRDVYINMGAGVVQNDDQEADVARQRLREALGVARMKAGNPTLKQMVAVTAYSEATLSRVFAGKALPSFQLLTKLAEMFGVEKSTFDTMWVPLLTLAHGETKQAKKAKEAAPTAVGGAAAPASAPAAPAGFECPSCGSWVVNPAKHIEWHMGVEPGWERPERPRLRLAE